MKKLIIFILSITMTLNSFSQVKEDESYIIIHPNFEIGEKRMATETTYQSSNNSKSNLESTSIVKQLIEITNKSKENFEIMFNYRESNLESYNNKLNQYYTDINSTDITGISEIKLKLNKWGYFDTLSYVNLTPESIKVYEGNYIKFAEWVDSEYSQDSLASKFNYQAFIGKKISNRNYKKKDITEILYNVAILPVAYYDKIIPIESETVDTIQSELSFIDGELIIANNKGHKFDNNRFELTSKNKFIIPENKYPIDYNGVQITHLEWEENQRYVIERDTGWPILKRIEIRKVFNDETIITVIETKYEQL